MELNPDGSLSIPSGTLDAQQLDALLHELAHLRSQMKPAVPRNMQQAGDKVVWQVDPDFAISMNATPNVTVAMRSSGFGWQVFALPPDKALALGKCLVSAAGHAHAVVLDEALEGAEAAMPH
jgi:hypothetical protein